MAYPWTITQPARRSTDWDLALNTNFAALQDFLNFINAPSDGYVIAYNTTSGRLEFVANGSGTDTGEVRLSAGGSKEYLAAKLGRGLDAESEDIVVRGMGAARALIYSNIGGGL